MKSLLSMLFIVGMCLSGPSLAFAQPSFTGSIVPCGGSCTTDDGLRGIQECSTCDLVALIQRVINFLIFAGVVIATLLFVYAGFLMVTSGGSESQISNAKGIFLNVAIGLVLVLAAWLIVNIIMNVMYKGEGDNPGSWAPWNQIICNTNAGGQGECRPIVIPELKEGEDTRANARYCFSEMVKPEGSITYQLAERCFDGPGADAACSSAYSSSGASTKISCSDKTQSVVAETGGNYCFEKVEGDESSKVCSTGPTARADCLVAYDEAVRVALEQGLPTPAGQCESSAPISEPTTPGALPEGSTSDPRGGLARNACDAIADAEARNKCFAERAAEGNLASIAGVATVNKGYCAPGTAFSDSVNRGGCTDISGLTSSTISSLQKLTNASTAYCASNNIENCTVVLTGGSEFGHVGEEKLPNGSRECVSETAHCSGRKVDLRINPGVDAYIESITEAAGVRSDGALLRRGSDGTIYAREGDHWDILF